MSTHKHINMICCAAVILSLLVTLIFMNAGELGIQAAPSSLGYEERLFDTSVVHTIDIVMDDWDSFIESCENEEYAACAAVIDGEDFKNIAIRAKGNTSLSSVSQMNSDRYSFKIEFDHYDSTNTYYGLDKLSLNNIIQDNTYMKDFLTYQLMNSFGVNSPLCSYAYIRVNGEDWGLYLAVEGVEDAFLQRNYGNDYGELYKPDSMSFGGGRGNGKEFDMDEFREKNTADSSSDTGEEVSSTENENMQMPQNGAQPPDGFDMSQMQPPDGTDMSQMQPPDGTDMPDAPSSDGNAQNKGMPGGSGMGSDDVKLQYIDDDPDSYANIFDSAKTDITDADKTRLISSLKTLSSGEDMEDAVDIEAVIRYFVVHNFVVNGDSYTGSMIHNYYLYEEDGIMSMIPWDYNLAFGTFQGSDATSAVNDPIDTPVSGGSMDDRPMLSWIFNNEEYTQQYHQYFAEFIETCFDSGYVTTLIDDTSALIAPYVEKDPTKFCTYDEFETGVETIRQFCQLRAQSVSGQLAQTIPSTSEGQSADSSALIDASGITLSDMGTMNNQMRGGDRNNNSENNMQPASNNNTNTENENSTETGSFQPSDGRSDPPDRPDTGNMPQNGMAPQASADFDSNTLLLLSVTAAVLLLALLFAARYKRIKYK